MGIVRCKRLVVYVVYLKLDPTYAKLLSMLEGKNQGYHIELFSIHCLQITPTSNAGVAFTNKDPNEAITKQAFPVHPRMYFLE